jgi:hypothetical protein
MLISLEFASGPSLISRVAPSLRAVSSKQLIKQIATKRARQARVNCIILGFVNIEITVD